MFDAPLVYKQLKNYNIDVKEFVLMNEQTTFRIGGSARLFVTPKSAEELKIIIGSAKELNVPYYVIGNGSNLLVNDDGYDGIIIKIGNEMADVTIKGKKLVCGAGALLSTVSSMSIRNGLKGFEWACGIPGTIGGAVAMNAGAYGGEIKDVIDYVTVFHNGEVERIKADKDYFGYRLSKFAFPEYIVIEAEFSLEEDDGTAFEKASEFLKQRKAKQPLSYPSAGSTFKRPIGNFAGALIEKSGLKGYSVGGAKVSELHAGFVINYNNATCNDVKALIEHIKDTVYKDSGIMLECEVKMI